MRNRSTGRCRNKSVSKRRRSSVRKSRSRKQNNISLLRSIYSNGYSFPKWVEDFKNYDLYTKSVTVYYDKYDNLLDVKKQTLQREPCNIAMKRYYNLDKMESTYGWKFGYYGEYFKNTHQLAPNIAIYCKTPVMYNKKLENDIHIINSIGYAFDNVKQPDFQYFIGNSRQYELIKRYEKIFDKIYACAKNKKLKTIVMSLVGANNFAILYEDKYDTGIDHFQKNIWYPAFVNSFERNKFYFTKSNIIFMGSKGSVAYNLVKKNFNSKVVDIGLFPENIFKVKLDETLFVNAWDPWSLPGNGNNKDNSLDGYIGRVTMIAPLCFPPTNQFLKKYVKV